MIDETLREGFRIVWKGLHDLEGVLRCMFLGSASGLSTGLTEEWRGNGDECKRQKTALQNEGTVESGIHIYSNG